MPRLKVCGVNDAAFAVEAARRGVDFLGLIFAEGSPRMVTVEEARRIVEAVEAARGGRPSPRFAGVFTRHSAEEIADIAARVGLDVVQLHGDYGADAVSALRGKGLEVWLLHGRDGAAEGVADAVLLDGRDGARSGGTGRHADWSLVGRLRREGCRVVLAGGISASDVAGAAATGADVVDVNSSLETSPGVKSVELLDGLLAAFRRGCAGEGGFGKISRMKRFAQPELEVLQEITTAVVRERNVGKLLNQVLTVLDRRMGMRRGTFTLLEGDELRIEASARELNAEERALGRYRIGEGITGLVAKSGRPEIVIDVRKDRRFLNRTQSRRIGEALSFICVPLIRNGDVIGTLSADREMRGDTTSLAKDVALLEIIANLVGEAAAVLREECAERDALKDENRRLRGMVTSENPGGMIGECLEMRSVYEQIRQVAPSEATVLVRGSSGTGKELVAKAIQELSARKGRPFVALNCAALPEALVESELFGHEKGAFTDARERRIGRAEAADGGTMFLDEIGDLSLTVQAKLLRFLQERTFSRVGSNEVLRSDVRFIAATSRNLEDLMEKRLFREDLYYRLSVFPIAMPDLRDRGGDVILLAHHFLSRMSVKYGRDISLISAPALNMLQGYGWPGNVRELENCIERAVLTAKDGVIHGYNLPPALQGDGAEEEPYGEVRAQTLDEQLADAERRILRSAIARHKGNRAAAGRELGVSSRMMNYRLGKLGLLDVGRPRRGLPCQNGL
ncbi:MAG: sigma 54-interacting transcriptional regulator [Kiritimatiellae bacterium]|nr:sigma 54-interacting transcriptional regulator [Kiritimatiellia bacterium]